MAAAAVLALAAVWTTGPARAARPADSVLSDPAETVRWEGSFGDAVGPSVGAACTEATCDSFSLTVDLPPEAWARPGGVEVGIRWADEELDLDLFVYGPDGSLVAQSDGFFASTGESVLLPSAANGVYTVKVSPRYTPGGLAYEGIAQVEHFPAVQPVRALAPDLEPLPPRNLRFATGAYLTDPGVPGEALSCYPEETAEQGARRCLRFDQIIANVGDGPFELRYELSGLGANQALNQRTYWSDGTHQDRQADTFEFHPAHGHFHYKNFAQSFLWSADGSAVVRTGRKNGFCMIDVEPVQFGSHGDGVRTYRFPSCNAPAAGSTVMVNGISVGWADVYNWYLADQYLEVTGLPAGDYVLETRADAVGTIVELDEGNNRACARVHVDEAAGSAAVLASGVDCPAL